MGESDEEALRLFESILKSWDNQDRPSYPVEASEFNIILRGGGVLYEKNKEAGHGVFRHSLIFMGKKITATTIGELKKTST